MHAVANAMHVGDDDCSRASETCAARHSLRLRTVVGDDVGHYVVTATEETTHARVVHTGYDDACDGDVSIVVGHGHEHGHACVFSARLSGICA